MADHILAIDQGTTSTRAMVFDRDAKIVAVAQTELTLHYPDNGWVEQDAEDIWRDTQQVCREAIDKAGLAAADIAAIGITNQRETTVVWDRDTGEPVCNAIVWQDRRTAKFCEKLKADGHEPVVTAKTGLLLDPYFSGTKVHWILESVDGAKQKARQGKLAFGTIDTFLMWRLTGGEAHVTDATNASRTLLFNIVTQEWDDELLAMLDIPASMLPEVKDNSTEFGTTTEDFIGAPVPVTGIAGDQQAALFGQACFSPGMIKSTYGTGCFALMNIGGDFVESKNRLLTTVAYRLNGKATYAVEGSIFVAGAAVQWLRDGLGIIEHAAETRELAESVDGAGGVYMVPAFTGLGAPYWDPDARAALLGMTRGTTKAHIARAALEAQGYQTQDLMEAMAADSGQTARDIRVDGGMVNNDWVCQFLADITGCPVERPKIVETTVLGAAYLAGLHVGVYPSLDTISDNWRVEKRFEPSMDTDTRQALYDGWRGAVRRVLT